jgi:serine/threonine-protein kinase
VPFQGDSPVTIALKQVNEAPVPPRAINPAVPPELEAVVLHALQKDPAARFTDAETFIAALQAAREGVAAVPAGQATAAFAPPPVPPVEPTQLTPVGSSLPPPVVPDAWAYPEEPLPPPEPRRRARWPWVLLVVLLLAGGGVAAYLLTRPDKVTVPDVVRKDVGTATAILGNQGFRADVTTVTSTSAPQGRVIRQDPQPGTKTDKGSTIGLVVSGGPGTTTIPQVAFKTERTARRTLRRAGFTKVTASDESSTAVDKGKVIRTSPIEGSVISKNTQITLFVSSGPEQVAVPSVIGKSRGDAQSALRDAGLRSTITTQESSSKDPGTVLSQSPAANTDVDKGSVVKLVVAKAPSKVDVPDLVGLSEDDADSALVDAGLKVRTVHQDVDTQDQDGQVIDQSPGAGRSEPKGSRVTITVGHFTGTPPTTPDGTTTTP